jgi:hypothetical protein
MLCQLVVAEKQECVMIVFARCASARARANHGQQILDACQDKSPGHASCQQHLSVLGYALTSIPSTTFAGVLCEIRTHFRHKDDNVIQEIL